MENIKQKVEITERLRFGMLLASIGGIMDAYSYMVRGKVFATGQTGNFVLVAVRFAEQDYIGMLHAIVPIFSFLLGIFASWHIFYSFCKEKQLLWKRVILITEIFILFIVGLIPLSYSNITANSLVAFAAALQYSAFRKVGHGDSYASIFCSGNMRSCADNYYKGIVQKDKLCLKKAFRYSYILLCFFAGAALGALASNILYEKAIWSGILLLFIAFLSTHTIASSVTPNPS